MKQTVFVVLGPVCLLLAHRLASDLATRGAQTVQPGLVGALALVGFAVWLALGPFFLWWSELAAHLSPSALGVVVINLGPAASILLLQLWQGYPFVAPDARAAAVGTAGGAATALVGGWSVFAAPTSSHQIAGLWLYGMGLALTGLASQTGDGITAALVTLAVFQLLATLLAAASDHRPLGPSHGGAGLPGWAGRVALAAAAGIPPLPGFVALGGALQATVRQHLLLGMIVCAGAALVGAAAAHDPSPARGRRGEEWPADRGGSTSPAGRQRRAQRMVLGMGLGLVLALGLYPAPLVRTFAAAASAMLFLR
jgi:multicomponent K+:H+ antiporter subunit D